MGRAQAIDFRVDQLDDKFQSLFPHDFGSALRTDTRVRDARARLDASMGAFRHTMTVQAQVVENIQSDTEALAEIVARSQGAEGTLQVSQATNQLLALTAKQQSQLQHMMAAQFRSEAVEQARRATQAAEARAVKEIPWFRIGVHARLASKGPRGPIRSPAIDGSSSRHRSQSRGAMPFPQLRPATSLQTPAGRQPFEQPQCH